MVERRTYYQQTMVMYIPERGDIVCTNFDPAVKHEQKEKRYALILSPVSFNKVFGLALAAPITSRVCGHAFETYLNDSDNMIKGIVLCQQIKMFNFKELTLQFVTRAPGKTLDNVLAKVRAILE